MVTRGQRVWGWGVWEVRSGGGVNSKFLLVDCGPTTSRLSRRELAEMSFVRAHSWCLLGGRGGPDRLSPQIGLRGLFAPELILLRRAVGSSLGVGTVACPDSEPWLMAGCGGFAPDQFYLRFHTSTAPVSDRAAVSTRRLGRAAHTGGTSQCDKCRRGSARARTSAFSHQAIGWHTTSSL